MSAAIYEEEREISVEFTDQTLVTARRTVDRRDRVTDRVLGRLWGRETQPEECPSRTMACMWTARCLSR